uniref:Protein translocase subunit SecA n=1 Tax=Bangiopsis subsimplex TaxID=139980 RepID=A0A1C9CCS3_9RHOD|nr:preprotein translocase subunit SecA [Bangiopsis subsimplex]AOM66186.1 preprotein translocase subunit SecA [Bangiopsis subsimplex]ARO90454.1 preprotein translocase subunit secA [Bangiopsis subsimplex]
MLPNFFRNRKDRKLNKYQNIISQISILEESFQLLSDEELRLKTKELKKNINEGNISSILPEAFALVREAGIRVLGLRLFEVQIIGGLVLNEGKIAEMKTGEGKSLVAALPSFINALMGNGVHVVTVNDYLAKRDSQTIGNIHRFLGLTVGLIQQGMNNLERQQNYACDITYVTNSELGFDYLRDNLIGKLSDKVIKSTNYCIVDEIDSILIDEARTPLIISVNSEQVTDDKYSQAAYLSSILKKDQHYIVDEKRRGITLTEEGIILLESLLQISNLYDPKNPWFPYIINAIKAKELFVKDIDYIIQNQLIVIIDESTGRVQYGRRWSDGLHQAVEAKENVLIQKETEILASITYQHLFLRYDKISGMSGTAVTEEVEFDQIYGLEVIEIPTNRPMVRKDLSDLVYKTEYGKWQAIAKECSDMYRIGRPVLVGTSSIEKSDLLSDLLSIQKIPHQLLNAKPENIKKEAQIIAQAGQKHMITIATNMAGRGTDIILGGNATYLARLIMLEIIANHLSLKSDVDTKILLKDDIYNKMCDLLKKRFSQLDSLINEQTIDLLSLENLIIQISENRYKTDYLSILLKEMYDIIYINYKRIFDQQKKEILQLGGLYVIGSERHESRRIDNQLRGRAGRQGDPGWSRFYLSLEDKLLRIFGGEKLSNFMEMLQIDDSQPIESPFLTQSIENAQKKVESFYYEARKQLFEYDEVLDKHRQAIFAERYRILTIEYLRDYINFYIEQAIGDISEYIVEAVKKQDEEVIFFYLNRIRILLGIEEPYDIYSIIQLEQKQLELYFQEQVRIAYDLKEAYWEDEWPGIIRRLERYILLNSIDNAWTIHLREMNILKDIIGWRSYGQQNPLVEYQNEAFSLFISLFRTVRQGTLSAFFSTSLVPASD